MHLEGTRGASPDAARYVLGPKLRCVLRSVQDGTDRDRIFGFYAMVLGAMLFWLKQGTS